MEINWKMISAADWNRLNPCCCEQPVCAFATVEIMRRDVEKCLGGHFPFGRDNLPEEGDEPYPDAFDFYSPVGALIPYYRTSTSTWRTQLGGTTTIEGKKFKFPETLIGTYNYTGTTKYDETRTRVTTYQKPNHEWPAGNFPLGLCPPESTMLPAAPPSGMGVSIGTAVDGIVPVTLQWQENRGTYTKQEVNGSPPPAEITVTYTAGNYEVIVDGGGLYGTSESSLLIHLNETDTSCHEFQVRATVATANGAGSPGRWSEPFLFSLNPNPCCQVEEPSCMYPTTGNLTSSLEQAARSSRGDTWEVTLTPGATTPGNFNYCSEDPPAIPAPGYWEYGVPALPSAPDHSFYKREPAVWESRQVWVLNKTWSRTPDMNVYAWQQIDQKSTGDLSDPGSGGVVIQKAGKILTEQTVLSDDRNQGDATATNLFGLAYAELSALDNSWGWISGGWGYNWDDSASAPARWPVIGDKTNGITCRIRQTRYRWEVPETHQGTTYIVSWNIARFHDQWLIWRAEYYAWAVAKYAFLHKPHPGEDTYPTYTRIQLPEWGGYSDDPETPEDEIQIALDAMIAAIDAITDPGAAPPEPTNKRPEIIGGNKVWEWSSTQGERPAENIADCDPTKPYRELNPPAAVPPLGANPTPEQIEAHTDALANYDDLMAIYEAAVLDRAKRSKRQSEWMTITPDRPSRGTPKPTPPPPLGADPYPLEIDVHARETATYHAMLAIWKSARRESFQICNVCHICGPNAPIGPVKNYDPAFLTTDPPPLDPTKENPERWYDWY